MRTMDPAARIGSGLALLVVLTIALEAIATDGVTEINQAAAAAGGITPVDTPGFPVTIVAGSYRLTGDLTVTSANTDAIVVQGGLGTGSTTIDLNGFTIQCSSGAGGSCGAGTGRGISAESVRNVTVMNGAVASMGFHGIHLGDRCMVRDVRTNGNGSSGIVGGAYCEVKGNVSDLNGQHGIAVTVHGLVEDNVTTNNGQDGIIVGDGTAVIHNAVSDSAAFGIVGEDGNAILNNTVVRSTLHGIRLEPGEGCTVIGNVSRLNGPAGGGRVGLLMSDTCGYAHNVLTENNAGNANPQVSGGTQIGPNVCGGGLCP